MTIIIILSRLANKAIRHHALFCDVVVPGAAHSLTRSACCSQHLASMTTSTTPAPILVQPMGKHKSCSLYTGCVPTCMIGTSYACITHHNTTQAKMVLHSGRLPAIPCRSHRPSGFVCMPVQEPCASRTNRASPHIPHHYTSSWYRALTMQLTKTFLPAGYPSTVGPGYLEFVKWQAVHHAASAANGGMSVL